MLKVSKKLCHLSHADGGQFTLRANHKGTNIFISFEDTGAGMPEEVIHNRTACSGLNRLFRL